MMMFAGFSITVSGICYFAQPLLQDSKNRPVPILIWTPFDINASIYWVIYTYEAATLISSATYTICQDVLMLGLMLQICKQLDILALRFSNIVKLDAATQESQFSGWIEHHTKIFQLGYLYSVVIYQLLSISNQYYYVF